MRNTRDFRRSVSMTALAIALANGGPVRASDPLPGAGTVAAGSAAIATSGNIMTVTQSSQRAVIDWNSFGVASGNSVRFEQPNATAAILNRTTGNTTIDGRIESNGQVFLVNPNGISVGAGGVVDTRGGFVASTLDISTADFMAGRLNFAGQTGSGGIRNRGKISSDSFVALIGTSVSHSGTITATLGKVALAAGTAATLDFSGDGFLQVALPADATDATGDALVDVSGTIVVNGGRVRISAAVAADAVRRAVSLSGTIEAKSVSGVSGDVVLSTSGAGSIAVATTGVIDASATAGRAGSVRILAGGATEIAGTINASGETGGRIDITGDTVIVRGDEEIVRDADGVPILTGSGKEQILSVAARLDASGGSQGGLVRIGGAYRGGAGDDGSATYRYFAGRFGSLPTLGDARTVRIEGKAQIQTGGATGGTLIVSSLLDTALPGFVDALTRESGETQRYNDAGHYADFQGSPYLESAGWYSAGNDSAIAITSRGTISALALPTEDQDLGAAQHLVIAANTIVVTDTRFSDGANGITGLSRGMLEWAASKAKTIAIEANDALTLADGFSINAARTGFRVFGSGTDTLQTIDLRAGHGVTLNGAFEWDEAKFTVTVGDGAVVVAPARAGAFIDARNAMFGYSHLYFGYSYDGSAPGELELRIAPGAAATGGLIRLGAIESDPGGAYRPEEAIPNFRSLTVNAAPGAAVAFYGNVDTAGRDSFGRFQTDFNLTGNILFGNNVRIDVSQRNFWVNQASATIGAISDGRLDFSATYRVANIDREIFNNPETVLASGVVTDASLLPAGGVVSAGSASISPSIAKSMTITQLSDRAVIDWTKFNIGAGNTLNFVQPAATSAVLNRVSTLGGLSTIAGAINANGQVFLINPNGVAIGATGVINTAGFVAASRSLSTTDFLAGNLTFGTGSGTVSNAGSITAPGALVALLGGGVINAGAIETGNAGTVRIIASGEGVLAPGGTVTAGNLTLGARDVVIGTTAASVTGGFTITRLAAQALFTSAGRVSIEASGRLFAEQGLQLPTSSLQALTLRAGNSLTIAGEFNAGGAALALFANDFAAGSGLAQDRTVAPALLDLSAATIASRGTVAGNVAIGLLAGSNGIDGGYIRLGTMNATTSAGGTANFADLRITAAPNAAIRFGGDISTRPGSALTLTGALQFAADSVITSTNLVWTDAETATVSGVTGGPVYGALVNNGVTQFRGKLGNGLAAKLDLRGFDATVARTEQYGVTAEDLGAASIRLISGSLVAGDTLDTVLAPGSVIAVGAESGRLSLGNHNFTLTAAGQPAAADKTGYFFDLRAPANNSLTIVQRQVTFAVADAITTYGIAPVISTSLGNILAGDVIGVELGAVGHGTIGPALNRLAAGIYDVAPTGLTGTAAANYVLKAGGTNGSLRVDPRALSFVADAVTATYGDPVTVGGSLSGILPGDAVTASAALTKDGRIIDTSSRIAAGTYAVQFGSIGGASAANYVVTSSIDSQLNVAQRAIGASVTGAGYVYGSPTSIVTLSGVLTGDSVAPVVTAGTQAFILASTGAGFGFDPRTDSGRYDFTVTDLSGTGSANYRIDAGTLSATVDIARRPLTWATNSLSRTYGTLAAPTATLTNVLAGDAVTAVITAGTETISDRLAAGAYALQVADLGGGRAGNYVLAAAGNTPGTLTVDPKSLVLRIDTIETTYGTLAVPTYSLLGTLAGDDVRPSITAFAGGQGLGEVTISERSPVGVYSLGVGPLVGAEASNYRIGIGNAIDGFSSGGQLTINRRQLNYSIADGVSTYGDTIAPPIIVSGIVADDNVTAILRSTRDGQALTLSPRSDAGDYLLSLAGLGGVAANNYSLAATGNRDALLRIAARPIGITGDYDAIYGTVTPTPLTNTLAGEALTAVIALRPTAGGAATGYAATTDAGGYSVGIDALQLPAGSTAKLSNYRVDAGQVGTLQIAQAPVYIATKTVASLTYGAALQFTAAPPLLGLKNGDTPEVGFRTLSTLSGAGFATAGRHEVAITGLVGARAGNYRFANPGEAIGAGLTADNLPYFVDIGRRTITGYTVTDTERVYGDSATPAISFADVLAGDTVLAGRYFLGNAGSDRLVSTPQTAAGLYTINVAAEAVGADSGNYQFTDAAVRGFVAPLGANAYTITPRTVGIAASVLPNQLYGNYTLASVPITGLLSGDSAAVAGALKRDGVAIAFANGQPDAGSYSLLATGVNNANYRLDAASLLPLALTIDRRPLSFSGTTSLVYGTRFSGLASFVTGIAAVDAATFAPTFIDSAGLAPDGVLGSGKSLAVGNYTINLAPAGINPANYLTTANQVDLTVTPYVLPYTLGAATIVYGASSPVGTVALPTALRLDDVRLTALANGAPFAARPNAGSYVFASPSLTGTDAGNYRLSSDGPSTGTLQVNRRLVSYTAETGSRVFAGLSVAPNFTATLSGVVPGDDVQAGTLIRSNNGLGWWVVGSYISQADRLIGADAANYTLVDIFTPDSDGNRSRYGTITIVPREIKPLAATWTYGDPIDFTRLLDPADLAVLQGDSRFTGFRAMDVGVAVPRSIAAFETINAGETRSYALQITSPRGNYVLSETGLTSSNTVAWVPRPIPYSIAAGSSIYGETPDFGAILTNTLPGRGTPTLALAADAGLFAPTTASVGTYVPVVTGLVGERMSNYILTPQTGAIGTRTVVPRPVAFNLDFASVYGDSILTDRFSARSGSSGLTNGDRLFATAVMANGAAPRTSAGTSAYDLAIFSGDNLRNYDIIGFGEKRLTITPRPLTAVIGRTTYGDSGTLFSFGNVIAGDEVQPVVAVQRLANAGPTVATVAVNGNALSFDPYAPAGRYGLTLNSGQAQIGGRDAANYTVASETFIEIFRDQKPVGATIIATSTLYADPVRAYTISGILPNDAAPEVSVRPWSAGTDAYFRGSTFGADGGIVRLGVGTYNYTIQELSDRHGNYRLGTQVDASLTILPRAFSFTLDIERQFGLIESSCLLSGCVIAPDKPFIARTSTLPRGSDVALAFSLTEPSGNKVTQTTNSSSYQTARTGRLEGEDRQYWLDNGQFSWLEGSFEARRTVTTRPLMAVDYPRNLNAGVYDLQVALTGVDAGNFYLDPAAPLPSTLSIRPAPFDVTLDLASLYGRQQRVCATPSTCAMIPETDKFLTRNAIIPGTDVGIQLSLTSLQGDATEYRYVSGAQSFDYVGDTPAGAYTVRLEGLTGADARNYFLFDRYDDKTLVIGKSTIGYQISGGGGLYFKGFGWAGGAGGGAVLNGVYGNDAVSLVTGLYYGRDTDSLADFYPSFDLAPVGINHLQAVGLIADSRNYELGPPGGRWGAGAIVEVVGASFFALPLAGLPTGVRALNVNATSLNVAQSAGARSASSTLLADLTAAANGEDVVQRARDAADKAEALRQKGSDERLAADARAVGRTDTVGNAQNAASARTANTASSNVGPTGVTLEVKSASGADTRLTYGPGYTGAGATLDAGATATFELLSASPDINLSAEVKLEAFVLTGAAGETGIGEGSAEARAAAFAEAKAEGKLQIKDGKLKIGGTAVAGTGAQASVQTSLAGSVGSISAGATVYSPGSVGAGFVPTVGFADGKLQFEVSITLNIGLGGFSFNFGGSVGLDTVKDVFVNTGNAFVDFFTGREFCDASCKLSNQYNDKANNILKSFSNPITQADAIMAAVDGPFKDRLLRDYGPVAQLHGIASAYAANRTKIEAAQIAESTLIKKFIETPAAFTRADYEKMIQLKQNDQAIVALFNEVLAPVGQVVAVRDGQLSPMSVAERTAIEARQAAIVRAEFIAPPKSANVKAVKEPPSEARQRREADRARDRLETGN